MSTASKKSSAQEIKQQIDWQEKGYRSEALTKAVGLVRSDEYDPKNIVKDAQVFYQFLKGSTK